MSRIDDLIAEHCPDGAEFKTLGSLCTVLNGYAFKSDLFNTDGAGLPLIRIRDINTGYSDTYFSGEYDATYLVKDGDLLIGMDGDFKAVRWGHGTALLNQRVCRLQRFAPELLPAFTYYYVQRELDRIHGATQQSTVKHLSSRELERARIPVPPLAIQQEVVSILDYLTMLKAKLESELEIELEHRDRQYGYYRDSLLTFAEASVRWATLGEVVSITSGKNKSRSNAGVFPVFGSTGVIGRTDDGVYSDQRLLVARVGANAGFVHVAEGVYDVSDNTLMVVLGPEYDLRFAFHLLVSLGLNDLAVGGGQPLITAGKLKGVVVPVPELGQQGRIAAILDKFDALISDLSVGLPAEITARRQQYEYYRDRLLTFDEGAA